MSNDDSTLIAEQELSEAIESHIEASADIIADISELEKKVRTWDMEDSVELRGWIVNMRKLLTNHFQISLENFTDIKNIPTQKIPEALAPYGIIAVDKKGVCLYGKEMNKLVHIDEIKKHYRKMQQLKKDLKNK